ncbi:MAG: histidine kinase [Pseudomonadales bacterium]|jgi:sensor histidine kinase YesM
MQIAEMSQNRHYQFWTLQLAGWTGWVTLFALRDAYWGEPFERFMLLWVGASTGLLLTTGLRYIYQFVWDRPIIIRLITVLSVSYVFAVIWQVIKNYSHFYYYHDIEPLENYDYMAYLSGILGYSYFLLLCWSGMYFGLKFHRLLQEEKEKSIRAESQAHEAQLRMLRYQLNPHFLFNTLNAISTLILEKNTKVANDMVSKLSNFLRYSLDKDPMQKVDLEHEISTMNLYLEIEQVRFDDRLQVEINIEESARKALVPSLLLQPLVENSIKYAVANREEGGKITIKGRVFAGDLLIEVIDDGPGIAVEKGKISEFKGIGLSNTRNRLQELYGARHSCKFGAALPHGLKIDIRIPFETEPGLEAK